MMRTEKLMMYEYATTGRLVALIAVTASMVTVMMSF